MSTIPLDVFYRKLLQPFLVLNWHHFTRKTLLNRKSEGEFFGVGVCEIEKRLFLNIEISQFPKWGFSIYTDFTGFIQIENSIFLEDFAKWNRQWSSCWESFEIWKVAGIAVEIDRSLNFTSYFCRTTFCIPPVKVLFAIFLLTEKKGKMPFLKEKSATILFLPHCW